MAVTSNKAKRRTKARASRSEPHAALDETPSVRTVTRTTDNKGRVMLGVRFANRAIIVEELNESEVLVKLALVIPEREAWLYKNEVALTSVRNGLAQAKARQLEAGPDVDADAYLAANLED